MVAGNQVHVGRLSFAVGSVQFTGRRSLDAVTTIVPLVVAVACSVIVVVVAGVCCLQRRVAHTRSKLSPTRTEYNVNYVHISEPSIQSDVSATTAPAAPDTGVQLPQTGQLSITTATPILLAVSEK